MAVKNLSSGADVGKGGRGRRWGSGVWLRGIGSKEKKEGKSSRKVDIRRDRV